MHLLFFTLEMVLLSGGRFTSAIGHIRVGGTGKEEGVNCEGSEESWLHFAQQFKTKMADLEMLETTQVA